MNEDDIAKKIIMQWNNQIDVPPIEEFLQHSPTPRRAWWKYSLAAALATAVTIAVLQLSANNSSSLSQWQSSTDFLLK